MITIKKTKPPPRPPPPRLPNGNVDPKKPVLVLPPLKTSPSAPERPARPPNDSRHLPTSPPRPVPAPRSNVNPKQPPPRPSLAPSRSPQPRKNSFGSNRQVSDINNTSLSSSYPTSLTQPRRNIKNSPIQIHKITSSIPPRPKATDTSRTLDKRRTSSPCPAPPVRIDLTKLKPKPFPTSESQEFKKDGSSTTINNIVKMSKHYPSLPNISSIPKNESQNSTDDELIPWYASSNDVMAHVQKINPESLQHRQLSKTSSLSPDIRSRSSSADTNRSLEKMIDTTDESDQLYSIPGEFVNHLIITTGGNELYDIPSSQNYVSLTPSNIEQGLFFLCVLFFLRVLFCLVQKNYYLLFLFCRFSLYQSYLHITHVTVTLHFECLTFSSSSGVHVHQHS